MFRTRHAGIKERLSRIGLAEEPYRDYCTEIQESASHFLMECLKYKTPRLGMKQALQTLGIGNMSVKLEVKTDGNSIKDCSIIDNFECASVHSKIKEEIEDDESVFVTDGLDSFCEQGISEDGSEGSDPCGSFNDELPQSYDEGESCNRQSIEREVMDKIIRRSKVKKRKIRISRHYGSMSVKNKKQGPKPKRIPVRLRKYQCEYCEYCCDRKSNLTRHVLSVHEKLRPFRCPHCIYATIAKNILNEHILSVHDKIKPYKCTLCAYTSSYDKLVRRHILTVHHKIKPYKCVECSYSCSSSNRLRRHTMAVHQKLKPFKCDQCEFACSENSGLSNHVLAVHEKIRHYKCEQCEYASFGKSELNRHIAFVHEKVKPFGCSQCNFVCSTNRNLRCHILSVHLKVRPFKCPLCEYASSTNSNLTRHMLSIHKDISRDESNLDLIEDSNHTTSPVLMNIDQPITDANFHSLFM